jgi:hypothetical protein
VLLLFGPGTATAQLSAVYPVPFEPEDGPADLLHEAFAKSSATELPRMIESIRAGSDAVCKRDRGLSDETVSEAARKALLGKL